MRNFSAIIILLLLICFLFPSPGCSTPEHQDTQTTPARQQSTPAAESPPASTEETETNYLKVMAENEMVFMSGEVIYAPNFIKNDISELEAVSTAIVKATAINAKPLPGADEQMCITLATIRIDEVIMSDGKIKVGSEIILVEYYSLNEDPSDKNKIIVSSSNGSMPIRNDKQYLLFLQESPQPYGDYAVAGAWQGKYPITEKTLNKKASDLSCEDLEMHSDYFKDSYLRLAEQVLEKYLR